MLAQTFGGVSSNDGGDGEYICELWPMPKLQLVTKDCSLLKAAYLPDFFVLPLDSPSLIIRFTASSPNESDIKLKHLNEDVLVEEEWYKEWYTNDSVAC